MKTVLAKSPAGNLISTSVLAAAVSAILKCPSIASEEAKCRGETTSCRQVDPSHAKQPAKKVKRRQKVDKSDADRQEALRRREVDKCCAEEALRRREVDKGCAEEALRRKNFDKCCAEEALRRQNFDNYCAEEKGKRYEPYLDWGLGDFVSCTKDTERSIKDSLWRIKDQTKSFKEQNKSLKFMEELVDAFLPGRSIVNVESSQTEHGTKANISLEGGNSEKSWVGRGYSNFEQTAGGICVNNFGLTIKTKNL